MIDNPAADAGADYGPAERSILSREAFDLAQREIRSWPGYRPTPLLELKGMAANCGIRRLFYKDEGHRFGLKSFKALGGAYAVLRALREHLGKAIDADGAAASLAKGGFREKTRTLTVAAATDGNHGRSVAWAAEMFGCECVIYLHEHVSKAREREIGRYGARIRRVAGNYDDSVRACIEEARNQGWRVIQDTSLPGEVDAVACQVMQGYQVLIDEALAQLPDNVAATHVFVQAGVGGLAAAVGGYLWERLGKARPRILAVEPIKADCVYRSIKAGKPTAVPGDINTFMACLAAGEVSPQAWPILLRCLDHVVALEDEWAPRTMRLLARGDAGDPPIVAGESGVAALAGLMALAEDPALKARAHLDDRAVALVIGSEGATDEETYRRVVGRASADVATLAAR